MKTAQQAVEAYDRGEILPTVEMGGISPGYEQCIQVGAIELIRRLVGKPLPAEATVGDEWGTAELHEIDRGMNLGLSGAQAGAIRSLAYRALRDGWDAMVESAPLDRRIHFSKHFPGAKVPT